MFRTPVSGVASVTFAIHAEQDGGSPLWSETLEEIDDIEFMAFPRLPGYAEMAWSAQDKRDWEEYKIRLAAQGPRFTAMGINFYASPEIDWAQEPSR